MRFLHTMLRVGNLGKSLKFYQSAFDMQVLKQKDYPEGKFTLAFIGYGNEENNTLIELTYNWDINSYEKGNGFGHIALETDDIYKACEKAVAAGGVLTRAPGAMQHGATIIAFIEDPDGYKIELIERKFK